jgi:Lipocalin-like domain
MILDRTGHFVMIISRRGLPSFAAKRRDAGTPDENKEVLAGLLAFFGKYTVNEPENVLSIRVEASTFPNWIGTDQKRYFTLSGDEMIGTNRTPAVGGESAKLVWKRAE